MVELSVEQIKSYREHGFLSIPRLTSDEDIAALRVSYDRIFSEQAGRNEGFQFDLAGTDEDGAKAQLPQILDPSRFAPEMNDSELLQNAIKVARQLLGDQARCTIAHAILKPALDGVATPWHQDAAYWRPDILARSISIWVPLQEATLENGCMQFISGSHKLDVLPHQSIGGDPRVHGLELVESAKHHIDRPIPCPIPAGGCTIHGGYTLHYAGPNRTDQPRRALILGAEIEGRKRLERRSYPWQDAWDTEAGKRRASATR